MSTATEATPPPKAPTIEDLMAQAIALSTQANEAKGAMEATEAGKAYLASMESTTKAVDALKAAFPKEGAAMAKLGEVKAGYTLATTVINSPMDVTATVRALVPNQDAADAILKEAFTVTVDRASLTVAIAEAVAEGQAPEDLLEVIDRKAEQKQTRSWFFKPLSKAELAAEAKAAKAAEKAAAKEAKA